MGFTARPISVRSERAHIGARSSVAGMTPVRIALIGLGRMGRVHAEVARGLPDVEIVAIADPSPDAVAFGVSLHPKAVGCSDPAAVVALDGVDACLIASPTPTHPHLVEAALAAGRHVLCEKPLALDPARAVALGDRARSAGRVLQVGFWRRYSPPWVAARAAIVSGAIGRPLFVRLSQWDADPPPPSFCDPAVSGGLAVDCGVHEFDLAEWLTDAAVASVQAWPLPIVDPEIAATGDLENLVAVAQLAGGIVATIDLSRNGRYGDDVRTEILGSDGAVFVELLPTSRARIGDRAGLRVIPGSAVDDAFTAGVAAQLGAFARAVQGDRTDHPGAIESARATLIGHQATASAADGRPRSIDDPRTTP